MTFNAWIVTVVGVVGCVKLLADTIFTIGRWTKKVEIGAEQKPKVTLDRLSWDLEQISKDIRDLRVSFDGRYAELSGRVTADHQLLREVLNWKAGIYTELSNHFYSIAFMDRIIKESEKDRGNLWTELDSLKAELHARRSGDTAAS